MKNQSKLPVAIIGAGPAGLAAAAHLTLRQQPFILFEAGSTVASHILSWEHIRVFSPWRYNLDKAAVALLAANDWEQPDLEELPTGRDLYAKYFQPLSQIPEIKPFLNLSSKVLAVGRKNIDKIQTRGREEVPFVLQVQHAEGSVGHYEAKAVIDASGTWGSPNPIGSGGVFAVGETENSDRIFYGIPDILGKYQDRYKNKRVLVVGGGHSAINAILELDRLKDAFPQTQIHWVLRKKQMREVYGGQENDALPARGALGIKIEQLVIRERVQVHTPFQVQALNQDGNALDLIGYRQQERQVISGIHEIISTTGSRPDFSFLREVRLGIDPSLESVSEIAELIDPNIHSCGTVRPHGEQELKHPEKDFYIVGSKSYGRAPTFLMATGYEQVRSVVAALDGDLEAARKIELELPETGVCSTDFAVACCGTSSGSEADGSGINQLQEVEASCGGGTKEIPALQEAPTTCCEEAAEAAKVGEPCGCFARQEATGASTCCEAATQPQAYKVGASCCG